MALIRPSSSSNRPAVSPPSRSSPPKCVNTCGWTGPRYARAGTGMPQRSMSWAVPILRSSVVFPPWFAPVIIVTEASSVSMSLPTTGSRDSRASAGR